MKKILFLVIDGLPDEPCPELGNQTPLAAAKRPVLDRLVKRSLAGFFKPLFLGELPDSEETHLALFGYDPRKNFPGRGVFEVLGIGEKLSPKDVCLRANLATVNERGEVLDRRAGRIPNEKAQIVVKKLNGLVINKIRFVVRNIYQHRLGIILKGTNLSDKISDTDDKHIQRIKECQPLDKSSSAKRTAEALNLFLTQVRILLADQKPANFVLTRGAGHLKKVISFERKWGLKAAGVSNGALYRGIAKFLGMALVKENGGGPTSSAYIKNKFLAAKKSLEKYDFVFCHIKGADLLAEDGQALKKKKFIETIDREMKLLENSKNTLLVVTSDHATSSVRKSHSILAVPFFIHPAENNSVKEFTETECNNGKKISNLAMMPLVLKLAR